MPSCRRGLKVNLDELKQKIKRGECEPDLSVVVRLFPLADRNARQRLVFELIEELVNGHAENVIAFPGKR